MIPRSDPYFSGAVFFTALIGSALITVSVEEPESKEKWVAPAAEHERKILFPSTILHSRPGKESICNERFLYGSYG
jgi:hypothetical protein